MNINELSIEENYLQLKNCFSFYLSKILNDKCKKLTMENVST